MIAAKRSSSLVQFYFPAAAASNIALSSDQLSDIMDFNSRMSQQYRTSQQHQQGRTKKKEEDPDAFMRLVSGHRSALN